MKTAVDTASSDSPIGAWLLDSGRLSSTQLARLQELQHEKGGLLGPLLVQLGFTGERELAQIISSKTGLPIASSEDYDTAFDIPDISREFLRQHHAVPLRDTDDGIAVAVADPSDPYVVDALRLAFESPLHLHVGVISEIEDALKRMFPAGANDAIAPAGDPVTLPDRNENIEHLRDMASEAPVIRRVNQMIARAMELHASDIHIEPFERELVIRYRVDGVLRPVQFPETLRPEAIVSRIKVIANLDIAERRLPQDGRIKLRAEGREIDMRISTVPTLHGESVVLRLLDRGDIPLDFEAQGFREPLLGKFKKLLSRPHGILLVTGPTGSGKTTTLYAALSMLNSSERKILTVEDPVEYQLEGINQIPIRPNIDLGFANVLRAILRQDPDVIMIGEMRDVETARIAIQAALTGHKVLSTLHTNDAISSITRLQDMHVEDYLLTSTIDGVLAQRLVRKLCPECKTPVPAPKWIGERFSGAPGHEGDLTIYQPAGCSACDHTGYRGRTVVQELLVMNDALRRGITDHMNAEQLRAIAKDSGMIDMFADGLEKVLSGITSLEEVERVVQAVDSPI